MSSEVPLVPKAWGRLAPKVPLRVASDGSGVGHFGITEGVMEFGTKRVSR